MHDKNDYSLENFVLNSSMNSEMRQPDWTLTDFNNVENADRKLEINGKFTFWMHDDAFSYFSDLIKEELEKLNDDESLVMADVPNDYLVFDILLWIYTKDHKKLRRASKSFTSYLHLIHLGIFLKMKYEFFAILLDQAPFLWKKEYFDDPLWSKDTFTYPILEKLVTEMQTTSYLKVYGKHLKSRHLLVKRRESGRNARIACSFLCSEHD